MFALKLIIVSDVVHSAPTCKIDDLVFLGGLVAFRTLIAYFLTQEIEQIVRDPAGNAAVACGLIARLSRTRTVAARIR